MFPAVMTIVGDLSSVRFAARYTRQAVPDGYQALPGPAGDQSRQFLLAGEGIEGVEVAAAASCAEPNAVMLFCSSIVKVVIIVLLGAALGAVMTWITPICLKSKVIVPQIDGGEESAITRVAGLRSSQEISDEGSRLEIRAQKRSGDLGVAYAADL
jgi:hypothetical protein